jgi:DNA-binding transcriptional LysR family regulator
VQWELAKQGVGMCMMMETVGDREPRVRRVLPELDAGFAFATWLVSHRELKTSRRIRLVFDLLAEALTEHLAPKTMESKAKAKSRRVTAPRG